MSCLFWNCQGIGPLLTVHAFGDLLRHYRPDVIFLSETKGKSHNIDRIKRSWNLNGVSVDRIGLSGGLALLWRKEIQVQLLSYSKNHIDSLVIFEEAGPEVRVTGIYGEPEAQNRGRTWDLIRTLHERLSVPWFIGGDFNEILHNMEKQGGRLRSPAQLEAFGGVLSDCGLLDLGYLGRPFTWSNNRPEPHTVHCRLDRVCTNGVGHALFPTAVVNHIDYVGSDHIPLLLQLVRPINNQFSRRQRLFRFEAMWIRKDDCMDIVRQVWETNQEFDPVSGVIYNGEECKARLLQWSKSKNPDREIKKIQDKMITIRNGILTEALKFEYDQLARELEMLYYDQAMYWKQRGKAAWMKDGDKNTSYFHAKASSRESVNKITGLRNGVGMWVTDKHQMETVVHDYFQGLFRSSDPHEGDMDEALMSLESRLPEEESQLLLQPFTNKEVLDAISHMSPPKSPGPDGYPALFYQKYWSILGTNVTKCVLNILNNQVLPPALNNTFIVLIPKVKRPQRMTEFRPISLCNVIYKIAAKAIANRLKPSLDSLISPCQSAFVTNRLITDNVLVAFEINHFINTKTRSKTDYMTLKLDVSKAYDRVEWKFLHKILLKLGIPSSFAALIMMCVSTVSYSYLLNGSNFGSLTPERGLRQGDPLSPYLFICVVEAFIGLVTQAERAGLIHGVQVAPTAPPIPILCFADDTMVFCHATVEEATSLKAVLETYALVSGQVINFEKSAMTFSKGTSAAKKEQITQILGVKVVDKHDRYLGMPAVVGKSKREIFSVLRDRIWKRINGWGEKTLSGAGREVLIKAVLQSVPNYIMSCFELPLYLIRSMESAIMRFWWGGGSKKKMAWTSWADLCRPKRLGGLGFRDLRAFNLALLAKQSWRLLIFSESLLCKVFKARYFPNSNFMEAQLGTRPSATWRGIINARVFLSRGIRMRIGNGHATRIWGSSWIPDDGRFTVFTPQPLHSLFPDRVADLIDPITRTWRVDLVNATFWPVDRSRILAIPVGAVEAEDRLVWHFSRDGKFSVKSCYHLINNVSHGAVAISSPSGSGAMARNWNFIWQLTLPPKIRMFIWRACSNILPTKVALFRRHIVANPICERCGLAVEFLVHSLFVCRDFQAIWRGEPFQLGPLEPQSSMWAVLELLKKSLSPETFLDAVVLCWKIWELRNKELHGSFDDLPRDIVAWAREYRASYLAAQSGVSMDSDPPLDVQWRPPDQDYIKINVDVALPVGQEFFRIGMVARDSNGVVLWLRVKQVAGRPNPTDGEAVAVLHGILLARDNAWPHVIVETDCLQVFRSLSSPSISRSLSSFGALCDACLDCRPFFQSLLFSFVRRSGNSLAHSLATALVGSCNEGSSLPSGFD